ncbi:hypothetical protein [Dermatophilus congolensis]|uniref:hypothetical protein n=1 Tax=Dermatophilus congolensis TaxID=1863 RepID=UPI00215D6E43|nr:hypothetical protein [Dermatophilus congolensis]
MIEAMLTTSASNHGSPRPAASTPKATSAVREPVNIANTAGDNANSTGLASNDTTW